MFKRNFSLIALLVAFLWCVEPVCLFAQSKTVAIIMDKAVYQTGKNVFFMTTFDGTIFVWPDGCWSIKKLTDGKWIPIVNAPSCPPDALCERPMWYETVLSDPYKHAYAQWDWARAVSPGRYKVRFEYALTIDVNDIFKRDGIELFAVEKEFEVE